MLRQSEYFVSCLWLFVVLQRSHHSGKRQCSLTPYTAGPLLVRALIQGRGAGGGPIDEGTAESLLGRDDGMD